MTHQHESAMKNKLKTKHTNMWNTLKRLHSTRSPHPPPNKMSNVRTGKMKTIEGKGTPLKITAVEVVEAGAKPGAGRAGPA